jgi:CubicO group peptidase (beta-lactamase class C family)
MAEIDWDRLRAVVGEHVAAGEVPGVVMAASDGGDVRVETVGGARPADEDGTGAPLAADAVVRIASMTKALTGALTMALVEEGALAVGDRVDRWIPELADRRVLRRIDGPPQDTVPANRPITVDDLLTLRMGFGFVTDSACPVMDLAAQGELGIGPPDPSVPLTPDAWIARFAQLPLMKQPGADWMYDLAYGVLGIVLARAAGRPLDELMRDRLLGPLGMDDTGFAVPEHARDRLIPAYARDDEGRLVEYDVAGSGAAGPSKWAERPSFPDARGGLVSTISDYLRFARMLLAGGIANDGTRVLSGDSVAALTSDQLGPAQPRSANARVFLGDDGWGYGVGVMTPESDSGASTPRYGWGGGFGTTWYSFPERDLAVVMATQVFPPQGAVINAFWSALRAMIGA